jgi:predicted Zn-ribbon and HTH transcriptional regulator
MRVRHGEFERIRSVLEECETDQPLTAREIMQLLEEHGEEFDSAHRVATILGRRARSGEVEVIRDQPYRYRFLEEGN